MKIVPEEKQEDLKIKPADDKKTEEKPLNSDQDGLKTAQNSKKRVEVICEYKNYDDLRALTDPDFCPSADSPQHKD
jgi:hypothetical protein